MIETRDYDDDYYYKKSKLLIWFLILSLIYDTILLCVCKRVRFRDTSENEKALFFLSQPHSL